MRAVIDTNVVVSALLKGNSPPGEVVADAIVGRLVALFDDRILEEYREVLARPRFRLPADDVADVLEAMTSRGVAVVGAESHFNLPDPDDAAFADVARAGDADLLITGNTRHFPIDAVIRVVTPREWVTIKKSMELLKRFGEDERLALERSEAVAVAMACKRCRRVRPAAVLGLDLIGQPRLLPGRCIEPDASQADGRCGGDLWAYEDNDLGKRKAAALGIPTLER